MTALLLTLLTTQAEPLPGTFSVAPDPRDTVEQTRLQERSILDEMATIDQELEVVTAEVLALQDRRADLQQRQVVLQTNLNDAEAALKAHQAAVTRWLRALYFLHRQGLARIIFGAEDAHTLRRRRTYLLAIVSADARRFDDFREAAKRRKRALSNLEGGLEDISNLNTDLRIKEADLNAQRTQKQDLLTEIRSQRALAMSVMQELNRTRRTMNSGGWANEMWSDSRGSNGGFSIGSGSDSSSAQPRCNNAGSFRSQYGALPWPVRGEVIRRFGPYIDPHTEQRVHNDGLDIVGTSGAAVTAVYGGVVKIAEYMRQYGYTVAIEHGAYTTVYAHLNGLRVRVGQEICSGDQIGNVGDSGLTEGSSEQLEFQIRYNNTPQDPGSWLRSR